MISRLELTPAALIRPASLDPVAVAINADHEAGQRDMAHALEHYKNAGQRLLEKKNSLGHGQWLPWLKMNIGFSERRVRQYMELANRQFTADMDPEDEWRRISGNVSPPVENSHDDDDHPDEVVDQPARHVPILVRDAGHSGDELYTPPDIIETARTVLGQIDLDPASCVQAQATVQAVSYYTKDDDGLAHEWAGRVWMNPPYSKGLIDRFAEKFCAHHDQGDITGLVLTHNCTETRWFQGLASRATLICFPSSRLQFMPGTSDIDPASGPTRGQAIFYFGSDEGRFLEVFRRSGLMMKGVR